MKEDRLIRIADTIDSMHEQINEGQALHKNEYRTLLVMQRFVIREVVHTFNATRLKQRNLSRQKAMSKQNNLHFLPLELRLERVNERLNTLRKHIAWLGEASMIVLDLWQDSGATLQELCNLFNKPYPQLLKEMNYEREDTSFAGIVFVHNLDHRDTGTGWIDWEDDAPFTHAIREFELDFMRRNPAAKQAMRKAMFEQFPEIFENALTIGVDDDGNQVLRDSSGMVVGTLESEADKPWIR